MYIELLTNFTDNTGESEPASIPKIFHRQECVVQAEITANGKVFFEGRIRETLPWHLIIEFDKSDASSVTVFPEMRARIENNNGTINASIWR